MDSYTSIKTCWFQKPQIFTFVLSFINQVRITTSNAFSMPLMQLFKLFIDLSRRFFNVFLYTLENSEHFKDLVVVIVNLFTKVKWKSQWQVIMYIFIHFFAVLLHIVIQFIFTRQSTMVINMIN